MQWDFWTLVPESAHQVAWLFGDRGIPRNWRHMNGYGSHTYSWLNAAGEISWVKYHFVADQERPRPRDHRRYADREQSGQRMTADRARAYPGPGQEGRDRTGCGQPERTRMSRPASLAAYLHGLARGFGVVFA
jgi:hypothetical protein